MQTINLEMSKDLSDALFNLRESSLLRGTDRGGGHRERRPPKSSASLDASEFLEGKSPPGHLAYWFLRFAARDDVSLLAAGLKGLGGRSSGARGEQ